MAPLSCISLRVAPKAVVRAVRKCAPVTPVVVAFGAVGDDDDGDDGGAGADAHIEIAPRWQRILNVTPAIRPSHSGLD